MYNFWLVLWCFAPTSNMLHVPFWQEHCHTSSTDLNTLFQCFSVLQCFQCLRQKFCLYRFIVPGSCSDPCEMQDATCFFLGLLFWWLCCCLIFFFWFFFLSVCSKVVISCNIGEVMWGFFFLLMGWLDCILPGLWCSAMWISVCWVPLYISVTNSKRECASCLPPAADSPQHSTPGKQVNTQPWCREHALLSC